MTGSTEYRAWSPSSEKAVASATRNAGVGLRKLMGSAMYAKNFGEALPWRRLGGRSCGWHSLWYWPCAASLWFCFVFDVQAGIEDRPWTLYRTPHVDVLTVGDKKKAATLMRDIALFRAVVSWLADIPELPPPARRVTFLVLEDAGDIQRLFNTPEGINGLTKSDLAGDFMVVVRPRQASTFIGSNQVVFHEYVHQLLQMRSGSRQPTWYSEGIADFLSTLSVEDDSVRLGAAPAVRVWSLRHEPPMKLEDILRVGSAFSLSGEDRSRFYARAWLLVHHLLLAPDRVNRRYPPRLALYLQKYDAGQDSVDSFVSTFGEIYPQLNDLLDEHVGRAGMVEYPLSTFSFDTSYETRSLTALERTLKLAGYSREFNPVEASRLYLRALSKAKDHPQAMAGLAVALGHSGDFSGAFTTFQAAQALAPGDFDVIMEGGRLRLIQCRAEPNVCKATQGRLAIAADFTAAYKLRPDDVEAKTRHAQYLLFTPERMQALPLLLEARIAAPWSFDIVQSLGLAYLARGDLVRARGYLEKALGWAVDYPDLKAQLTTLLSGIEALEQRQ